MKAFRDENGKIYLTTQEMSRFAPFEMVDVEHVVTQADALRLARELIEAAGVKLPKGKGDGSYECIPCPVIVDGQTEIRVSNCTHKCWDDNGGDDNRYDPLNTPAWIPLSDLLDWESI